MSVPSDAVASSTEPDAGDDTTALDEQLTELAEAMERVRWQEVPTISTPEAAAWTSRLAEARAAVRERRDGSGDTAPGADCAGTESASASAQMGTDGGE